jgi:hypothetical protein
MFLYIEEVETIVILWRIRDEVYEFEIILISLKYN